MFIYAVTTDIPPLCVCVFVFAIFIYVDVEVRGQHLVLYSDTILLGFFLEMEPLTGLWNFLNQSGWWACNTWSYTCLYLSTKIKSLWYHAWHCLHAFWGSNQVLMQAWQVLYQQSHLLRASQLCSFFHRLMKNTSIYKTEKNSTEKRLLLIPVETMESKVLNMWASKWEGK